MPIPPNPNALLPIVPLMFPDTFTVPVTTWPAGSHGGSTPTRGSTTTVTGYAQSPLASRGVAGQQSGQPQGTDEWLVFFPDAGTGVSPVTCTDGGILTWTAHDGVAKAVPVVLVATKDAKQQGPVWCISCVEQG